MSQTSRPTVRAATKADIQTFYGRPVTDRYKAIVVEDEGRILGLGGVIFRRGSCPTAFMDAGVGVDPKDHLRSLAVARKRFMEILSSTPGMVYAVRTDGSPHFLNRVGFVYIGDELGMEVWRWDR